MLVEAIIVSPVFLLLVFGALEWSYTFLDRLAVKNTSLVAARVGSTEGNNATADYAILQAAKTASSAMKSANVQLVVVYKASGGTASVPAGCLTSSVAGTCNRYTGADFTRAITSFGCGGGSVDAAWCPSARKFAVGGANGPPDYLGVYIQGLHQNVTGLLGKTFTFRSDTVIRIEPARLA